MKVEGYKWYSNTCSEAARGGHLGVSQLMREDRCEWDSNMCRMAATFGHLKVLKWAIRNGCPYNADDFKDISDSSFGKWFREYTVNSFNQV